MPTGGSGRRIGDVSGYVLSLTLKGDLDLLLAGFREGAV